MADAERTEVPLHGDERAMLNAFLDAQRDTLAWKCSGLTPEQLKDAASPPSPLTLLGLLRHLTEVEYFWMEGVLLAWIIHEGLPCQPVVVHEAPAPQDVRTKHVRE